MNIRLGYICLMLLPMICHAVDPTLFERAEKFDSILSGGNILQIHDPSVIKLENEYVLFSTSGDSPVRIYTSPDLGFWKAEGTVFPGYPGWMKNQFPQSKECWAPDAVVVGHEVRLYYSVSRFGSNDSAIALATKSLDEKPWNEGWIDRGIQVQTHREKDDYNAIDPQYFIDEYDHRHWLLFGSFFSGIKMIELNPETGKPLEGGELHNLAFQPRRAHDIEAPFVIRHDGHYFLFMSGGFAARGVGSSYHLLVGKADQVTGPYVDREGKSLLEGGGSLFLKSYYPVFGPGHCGLFQGPGGWWMAHHYYDPRFHWHDDLWGVPTLQLRPVIWTQDGWPLPGPSGPGVYYQAEEPVDMANAPVGRWLIEVDFTNPIEVTYQKDGTARSRGIPGNWKREGNQVSVDWIDPQAPNGKWTDRLTLAPGGNYMVGYNQLGKIIRAERQDIPRP